jgi:hypothetical protein
MILLGNSGFVIISPKISLGLINDPSILQLPIDISSESLLSKQQLEKSLQLSKNAESLLLQEPDNDEERDHSRTDNTEESNEPSYLDEDQYQTEKRYKQVGEKGNSVFQEKNYIKYEEKENDSKNSNDNNQTPTNTNNNNQGTQNNNQNKQKNIKGPVKLTFVDSYWTNNVAPETVVASISSGQVTAQQMPPVARQEVDPGEGNSVLAVTIINQGFSDISGVKGYFDFPNGFKALVTPDNVDSDTAISSYNGVVKAGQSFVLYFPVNILQNTQVGKEYQGDLKIKYFKLTEQSKKDFRTANIEVPFRLTGKVILELKGTDQDSIAPNANGPSNIYPFGRSDIINVMAGSPNTLDIKLSNKGTATATGVTVNVLNSNQQVTTNVNPGDGSSNSTLQSSQSTTQVPFINLGNTVFNVGSISPQQEFSIDPVIFPPASSGNVLQNIDIRISFNDAYGNKKTINHLVGIQIVPTSPQNDLYVSPATVVTQENTNIQPIQFEKDQFIKSESNDQHFGYEKLADLYPYQLYPLTTLVSPKNHLYNVQLTDNAPKPDPTEENQIQIVAGKVSKINFSINGFDNSGSGGKNIISNLAVSITPQSPSVKIVGKSLWNLPTLGSQSNILSTDVFASPSLIGNPIFFTVKVQYLKNYQELKTATFNLGAIITGNIKLSVNDLTIRAIGNQYNLAGNILNEGNSVGQFSKISILDDSANTSANGITQESPLPESEEYIGDLPVNIPIPFNIPLSQSMMSKLIKETESQDGSYQDDMTSTVMIPLKLTYTDSVQMIQESINSYPLTLDAKIVSAFGGLALNNGFVDSYWAVDAPLQSNSASTTSFTRTSIQKAVAPGDGSSILAVELTNTGFADISGITGYLRLPPGFQPDNSQFNNGNNELPYPDTLTAVSSNGNIIKSGQTYTLYFKVKVLESATIGNHIGSLTIFYFKVPDTKVGTYRTQEIDFPFYLPGKPILDPSSNATDLEPGISNPVKIYINNRGSAPATGATLQISESDDTVISSGTAEIIGRNATSASSIQDDSVSVPLITTGQSTFDLKSIPVNGYSEVQINIIPSVDSEESLQKLNLHLTYVNPVGVLTTTDKTIGFRVLPNPPDGGLSVTGSSPADESTEEGLSVTGSSPADESTEEGLSVTGSSPADESTEEGLSRSTNSSILNVENNTDGQTESLVENSVKQPQNLSQNRETEKLDGELSFISLSDTSTRTNYSNNLSKQPLSSKNPQDQTIFITAGKIDDFRFNITNNNDNEIRNAVVTLTVNTDSLEILGSSKWDLTRIDPKTSVSLPTKIFASTSLINSPVSFNVNIEYVSNGQLKTSSFNIGANVVGEIDVSVNDLAVDNIGGILNVVGNLLNKGNTGGLFTTVELVTDEKLIKDEINKMSLTGKNVTNLRIVSPLSTTPQYLGDLEEDSPLPFNIPLSTSNKSSSGNYLVPLKIEYYDDLRNLYTVFSSNIVNIEMPPQPTNDNQGLGSIFSGSNPLGFIILIIVAVIVLLVIRYLKRRRRNKKQKSKKQLSKSNNFIDLLDNVKKSGEINRKDESEQKK